jgi:hypothetical protein
MTTVLLFILLILGASVVAFFAIRKSTKTTSEPLGYEAAPVIVAEPVVEKKKTTEPKVSKNTAKNKSLAKMEAKPRKTTTKNSK